MRKRKANPDFYRQGFKALFTRIMSLEDYGKLKESEKPKIVGRSTIADKQEFIVELTEDEIKDPTRMEKHVRGQLERETSSGKYLNPQTGKQLFCKGRLEALTDYENILFPEPHNLTHKRNEVRQYESLLAYRKALEAVCGESIPTNATPVDGLGSTVEYPIAHPFPNDWYYRLFQYLHERFLYKKLKARWTYIYNGVNDEYKASNKEASIAVVEYFRFLEKHCQIFGFQKGTKNQIQHTATNETKRDKIEESRKEFKDQWPNPSV